MGQKGARWGQHMAPPSAIQQRASESVVGSISPNLSVAGISCRGQAVSVSVFALSAPKSVPDTAQPALAVRCACEEGAAEGRCVRICPSLRISCLLRGGVCQMPCKVSIHVGDRRDGTWRSSAAPSSIRFVRDIRTPGAGPVFFV